MGPVDSDRDVKIIKYVPPFMSLPSDLGYLSLLLIRILSGCRIRSVDRPPFLSRQ